VNSLRVLKLLLVQGEFEDEIGFRHGISPEAFARIGPVLRGDHLGPAKTRHRISPNRRLKAAVRSVR
jgi:hypothetical protein